MSFVVDLRTVRFYIRIVSLMEGKFTELAKKIDLAEIGNPYTLARLTILEGLCCVFQKKETF